VGSALSTGAQLASSQLGDRLDELRGLAFYATQLDPATHAARLIQTTLDWWRQRSDCTPASFEPPPVPERRIAVLVGGLGSKGGVDGGGYDQTDSIDRVRAVALGYDDHVRFSYVGGDTAHAPYDGYDTAQDLRTEARRLRDLLEQVARDHPGETVDIIAHSQGGIISRAALAYEYAAADPRLPKVANLITLASPHQGDDLATALTQVGDTATGRVLEHAVGATGLPGYDPGGTSIRQLSETSRFMAKLDDRPLPKGIRFTSIGSRGDFTVPGIRTRAPGARNVLVDVAGLTSDHRNLPGSDAGRREVALAAAGLPPTCQTLTDMLADTLESDAIATGEDAGGLALSSATHTLGGP
jgi:pimeloyl-ACP methyl ester carboxylesterase